MQSTTHRFTYRFLATLIILILLIGCKSDRPQQGSTPSPSDPEGTSAILYEVSIGEEMSPDQVSLPQLAKEGIKLYAFADDKLLFQEQLKGDSEMQSGAWHTTSKNQWTKSSLRLVAHNSFGSYAKGDLTSSREILLQTPTALSEHSDILVASTTASQDLYSGKSIPLYFRHILSQVEVRAINQNSNYRVEVAGAMIARIGSESQLTLPDESKQSIPLASYSTPQSVGSFVATTATPWTLTEKPQIVGQSGEGFFMLIPQQITPWDPEQQINGSNDNGGTYVALMIRLLDPNGKQLYPMEYGKYAYTAAPLHFPDNTLKPGLHYTITLDLSQGVGYQAPSFQDVAGTTWAKGVEVTHQPMADSDVPGTPITEGAIKSSITVTPWQSQIDETEIGIEHQQYIPVKYGTHQTTFSLPKETTELQESDLPNHLKEQLPGLRFIEWQDGKGQKLTFPHMIEPHFVLVAKVAPCYATFVIPTNYKFKDPDQKLKVQLLETGELPNIPQLLSKTGAFGKPLDDRGFVGWSVKENPKLEDEVVTSETKLKGDTKLYAILTKGSGSKTTGMPFIYLPGTEESTQTNFTFASDVQKGAGLKIDKLYVAKYPVTQEEYQKVMGQNPSYFTSPDRSNYAGNKGRGVERTDALQRPVESVTWMDAIRFCNKLSIADGLTPAYQGNTPESITRDPSANGYRLPTEAEWIWIATAASGDNNNAFARKTTAFAIIGNSVWFRNNAMLGAQNPLPGVWEAFNNPLYGTRKVGTKEPNEAGIYDLSGNVWEWVEDWYGTRTYHRPNGPQQGTHKVLKGGSFHTRQEHLNVDYRRKQLPNHTNRLIGFRIVRPLHN